MFHQIKKWNETNQPFLNLFKNYWSISSRYEKLIDVGLPIFLTVIIHILIYFKNPEIKDFLPFTNQIFNTIITVLSILAGFNVAAVSIIISSQSPIIKKLAEKSPKTGNVPLKGFVAFFMWAIAIQLIVLLVSILYLIVFGLIQSPPKVAYSPYWGYIKNSIIFVALFFVFSASFHSIFLSIRNIVGLFLAVGKNIGEPFDE